MEPTPINQVTLDRFGFEFGFEALLVVGKWGLPTLEHQTSESAHREIPWPARSSASPKMRHSVRKA